MFAAFAAAPGAALAQNEGLTVVDPSEAVSTIQQGATMVGTVGGAILAVGAGVYAVRLIRGLIKA
jgi:hypothetical protein